MNVTYLLGAGASAGENFLSRKRSPDGIPKRTTSVIPVVAHFTDSLISYLEHIGNTTSSGQLGSALVSSTKRKVLIGQFKSEMPRFIDDLRMHQSVDTLARKYFVKYGVDSRQLTFLKFCVSSFLVARQFEFGVDARYDLFFSAIGERCEIGGLEVPDSVAIVSWNYDNQLELSLNGFHEKGSYQELRGKLNLFPQTSEKKSAFSHDSFSVLKLNGTCDLVKIFSDEKKINDRIDYLPYADYDLEKMTLKFSGNRQWLKDCILKVYDEQFNEPRKHGSLLSFSWEHEPVLEEIRSNASTIAERTHVLVVIGYSFPTFNRKMDRVFIEGLMKGEQLQKIYVQVTEKDFVSVKSRLSALLPKNHNAEIEFVPQLDEFYVPYELDWEVPKKKAQYSFAKINEF
jgi:hypothetical protein